MDIIASLMIIFIINIQDIAILYLERNAPVPANFYRPTTFTIAFECMQSKTWQIHIFCRFGGFKEGENLSKPRNMLGIDTT